MIELDNARVYLGSNLDILPTLPDNSVDSIVTDPPYELGFMGKSWDSSGIAYSVELWQECMRVLKPGGHLLAFGGSRTWHRLAVAIEDAGFDMRDSIAWLYGSGFPKSLDVSKAIDKRGGNVAEQSQFAKALRQAKAQTDLTIADLNEILGNRNSNLWSHFVGDIQPQVPTTENYLKLKAILPLGNDWDSMFLAEAEREVIGSKTSGIANKNEKDRHTIGASKAVEVDITAPATPEAVKWQGWGTALKPAFEPVVVARKPLIGTVAQNVLTYGTGGLNIDGSRIGRAEGDNSSAGNRTATFGTQDTKSGGDGSGGWEQNSGGRWPANIILDPYTAELLDEQSGILKSGALKAGRPVAHTNVDFRQGLDVCHYESEANSGGASRFFYVAKASKRDRNEGLEGLEGKEIGAKGNGLARACATCGATVLDGCDCPDRTFVNPTRQNFHPTVKPTSLMEYLIKLVTPEGGTVLDPFTGSGSTGKAALLNGFQFIGIELTEEYLPIIEGRLRWANEQRNQDASQSDKEEKETLF